MAKSKSKFEQIKENSNTPANNRRFLNSSGEEMSLKDKPTKRTFISTTEHDRNNPEKIGYLKTIAKGYESGFKGMEVDREWFKASEGQENNAMSLQRQYDANQNYELDNEFKKWLHGAMAMVGQNVHTLTDPVTAGAIGAAGGSTLAIGQMGPLLAAPEEVVTVPLAMYSAYRAASSKAMYEAEKGSSYKELVDLGVSENTAQNISNIVGLGSGALEFLQVGKILDAFKLTKNIGAKQTKTFLGGLLKERGIDVLKETGQEIMQEGVQIAGSNIGRKMEGLQTDTGLEVASRLLDTGVQSLGSFALLNVPSTVMQGANYSKQKRDYQKKSKREFNEYMSSDKETVDAIIETGLDSPQDSESFKIASILKEKMDSGINVSSEEIGQLYDQNSKQVDKEENAASKVIQKTVDPTIQEAEDLANKKTDIQNSFVDTLGTNGRKNYIANVTEDNLSVYTEAYKDYYDAGRIGLPYNKIPQIYKGLVDDIKLVSAYDAGINDRVIDQVDINKQQNSLSQSDMVATFQDQRTESAKPVANETVEGLKSMTEAFNTNIVLRDKLATATDDTGANGIYSRGTIYISAEADRPLYLVVKHEVTHHIQANAPKAYKEYKDYIAKTFYQGEKLTQEIDRKIALAEANDMKLTRDEAIDEIAADATEKFLTDEKTINEIAKNNPKLGAKIILAIKDTINKIKSIMTQNKGFTDFMTEKQLKKAEKLWTEALIQARSNNSTTMKEQSQASIKESLKHDLKYSVKEIGTMQELDKFTKKGSVDSVLFTSLDLEAPDGIEQKYLYNQKYFILSQNQNYYYGETVPMATNAKILTYLTDSKVKDYRAFLKSKNYSDDNIKSLISKDLQFGNINQVLTQEYFEFAKSLGYEGVAIRSNKEAANHYVIFNDKNIRKLTGEIAETVEFLGGTKFSLREKPAPQKTITGYKAMRVKASQPGKLFPLFVNANDETPSGVWLDADFGDNTKTKLGKLAPRPGWHLGDLPRAKHIGKKNAEGIIDRQHPDIVWCECEVAADIDWQDEANKRGINKNGKLISKNADIKDELPVDGYYRYKTNPNMEGEWIISGAIKINRILSDKEVDRIQIENGLDPIPREAGELNYKKYGLEDLIDRPLTEPKFSLKDSEGNTLTKEQQEYFKDSKVRDHDGNLLVVYHGTEKQFTTFRPNYAEGWGKGIYFTDNLENTDEFGEIKYACYLNIVNPYDTRVTQIDSMTEIYSTKAYKKYVEDNFASKEDMSFDEYLDEYRKPDIHDMYQEYVNYFNEAIRELGFDGIIAEESNNIEGLEIVAFNPEQIKNIDNTNPTTNPDIRYSIKDSKGNELSNEQQTFFKKSQARDENGNLKVLYHGSPSEFTVFDKNKVGNRGTFVSSRLGFYFTDDMTYARIMGNTADKLAEVYEVYLNIEKPLHVTTTELFDEKGVAEIEEQLKGGNYDGIIDELGNYVAFYPEQIKYTDNLNPTDSDDIRYSLKDDKNIDKLVEINLNYKKKIKYLESQMQLSKIKVVDENQAISLSKKIAKQYDSTGSIEKISKSLIDVYKLYQKQAPLEEAYIEAEKTAKEIVAGIKIINDEYAKQYKDLKKYLKTTRISISDKAKKDIPDYNSFRKRYFQKINLANDGMNIDKVYQELSDKYPDLFTNDNYTEADQLLIITSILDSLQPAYESLTTDAATELIDEVASDILVKAYEVRTKEVIDINPIKPTFADKKEKEKVEAIEKIKKQYKDEFKKYSDEVQEKFANVIRERQVLRDELVNMTTSRDNLKEKVEKLQKYIAKMKEKQDEKLIKTKVEYQEKIYETRMSAKEKVAIKKERDKLEKHFDWLSERVLNPTDEKHVPQHLLKSVAQTLLKVDFDTKRAEALKKKGYKVEKSLKLHELRKSIQEVLEEQELDIDMEVMTVIDEYNEKIDNMETTKIEDMTSDELKDLNTILKAIRHAIGNANKVFNENIKKTITKLGDDVVEENINKPVKEARDGVKAAIDTLINHDNVNPADKMHEYGPTMELLYNEVRKGYDKHILNVKTTIEYMEKVLKGVDTTNLLGDVEAKKYKVSGGVIELTRPQLMSLYLLAQREQAVGHILGAGVVPMGVEVKDGKNKRRIKFTDTVRIQPAELIDLVKQLTPDEIKIANAIQKFFNTVCQDWGNEVSMKMYGYKKFGEPNYFPIKSSDMYLNTDVMNSFETLLKNMSFTKKPLRKANNPLVVDDIFNVFTDHVNKMSMYNALVLPLTDFQRVFNYNRINLKDKKVETGVKSVIERVDGKAGVDYVKQLLKDINAAPQRSATTPLIDKMLTTFKKVKIGANLRVLVQQPTSIIRAMDIIDPQYIIQGLKEKGDINELRNLNPIAYWKALGFYQTNTSRTMKEIFTGQEDKLDKWTMGIYGKADDFAWSHLWNAVKLETKDKYPDLTQEEFLKKANERFNYVIDRTQVVDTILHRSQLMRREDTYNKVLNMFMNEPIKNFNMLRTDLMDAKKQKDHKLATRSVLTYVAGAIALAIVTSPVDAIRDEDEEKLTEKILKHFMDNVGENINPLGMIPVAKEINSLLKGYTLNRVEFSMVNDVMLTYRKWTNGKYSWPYLINETVAKGSQFLGIPYENFRRDVMGIARVIFEAIGGNEMLEFNMAKLKYNIKDKKNKSVFMKIYNNTKDYKIKQKIKDEMRHME